MRIDMRGPDGTVYPMVATFREVVAPERLSFSTAALDPQGRPTFETLTTVSFHVLDGTSTEVRVRFQLVWATPAATPNLAGAEVGWRGQMDRLEAYVARWVSPTGRADVPTTFTTPPGR